MREILFRGKRLDNGEWVASGNLLHANDNGIHSYYIPVYNDKFGTIEDEHDNILSIEYGTFFKVDPATVGQYTGLKDKNGKKIFEGDIWDCNGCIGVIKWVEEVCSFEANYVMHGIEYANAVSDYRAAKVEVIGNIHDNPELLGGDES